MSRRCTLTDFIDCLLSFSIFGLCCINDFDLIVLIRGLGCLLVTTVFIVTVIIAAVDYAASLLMCWISTVFAGPAFEKIHVGWEKKDCGVRCGSKLVQIV